MSTTIGPHLTRETLSRIADEGPEPAARAHLDACADCRAELEAMRGLLAALRTLPEPEVPEAVWAGVVRRLVAEGRVEVGAGARRRPAHARLPSSRAWRWAYRAAGAAAFLAIGFAAGRWSASPPGVEAGGASEAARPATVEDAVDRVAAAGAAYREAVAALQGFQRGSPEEDARLLAERLAALDALVDASREALRVVPEDPVVNGYLYAALRERERLVASFPNAPGAGSVVWR
jgi:hypothetical protein